MGQHRWEYGAESGLVASCGAAMSAPGQRERERLGGKQREKEDGGRWSWYGNS